MRMSPCLSLQRHPLKSHVHNFIHSFIHSPSKCSVTPDYVPGAVLVTEPGKVSASWVPVPNPDHLPLCFQALCVLPPHPSPLSHLWLDTPLLSTDGPSPPEALPSSAKPPDSPGERAPCSPWSCQRAHADACGSPCSLLCADYVLTAPQNYEQLVGKSDIRGFAETLVPAGLVSSKGSLKFHRISE